ncbi:MAG: ABC transporter ATP-binding protein [Oenococcus sp.]|uniref:ABC transporter ATP-binding protein n=1 Tax=Oenococcus sp. TaxID=1979414 RepID=UPI0039EA1748
MILEITHLSFNYKNVDIFKDASMQIEKPGVYGLVAPNGSGKTTLLDLIAGFLSQQRGEIRIFGQSNKQLKSLAPKISYVQDNRVLYQYLSAQEHLNMVADLYHVSKERVAQLVKQFALTNFLTRPVSSYSLGQKQRILIAMAMVTDPQLIFLDEPLNGLDPDSVIIIRNVLKQLALEKKTVLVSSHNLDELAKTIDTFFYVKNKQLFSEQIEHFANLSFKTDQPEQMQQFLEDADFQVKQDDGRLVILVASDKIIDLIRKMDQQHLDFSDPKIYVNSLEDQYQRIFD